MHDATERFGEGSAAVQPYPLGERQKPDFNQIVVRDGESVCLNGRFRPDPTLPVVILCIPWILCTGFSGRP